MLKNLLHIAFRNLKNYKAYSLINIIGLTIGITSCIVIMLFVSDELSYDRFNTNADQIYRPTVLGTMNGHDIRSAMSPAPMGAAIFNDFPEVIAYTRLHQEGPHSIRYKNRIFSKEKFLWADSTLFDVFTLPFITGNPRTALTQPNTVIITESTASKFFGSENPIGKILNIDKRSDYIVTGVIKDIPRNSHFHAELIGSLTTVEDSRNHHWLSNNYYTYFLLRKGIDLDNFERKLNEEFRAHAGPQLKSITGVSFEQFFSSGNRYGYVLQPLSSIHLTSNLDYEIETNSSISYVYIFSAIAAAILLIACINFINLATARSEKRAKEVGIRKTLGSSRTYIVGQFMAESVLMSGIAVICAVGIVEVLLPLFNDMANKKMALNLFSNSSLIPFLLLLPLVVGVIAGSYPAFYLSSFRPIDVLKSKIKRGGRKSIFRNGLVVFQFTISIILFIGTFVIYSQLNYVQNKNLGFEKEETMVIYRTDNLSDRIQSFEDELRSNKDIIAVTNSNGIPGNQSDDSGYWLDGTGVDQIEDIQQMFTDFNFAKTYGLKMAAGRFFSKEHPSDTIAVVVNQQVEKAFGVKNIVGKYLVLPGVRRNDERKLLVVGVMKDFNYKSLHEPVRPLIIRLLPKRGFTGQFVTIRLSPGNHLNTIAYIENIWKKYAGKEAFSFNFLDENLQRLYIADKRTNKIAGIFSFVAIFIACLGLLGLAAFVTERRIKEIGIRKVLGASEFEVILLLSKDFAKCVLIASIISWPLAYYFMNNWLKNFAYRIDMNPVVFLASGVLALIIALLTVSSHAIKAAKANPVDSLKYE